MRIVLDTNILVSALMTTGGPPDLLYAAWERGAFDLVTSPAQIGELRRVLGYERLRPYITGAAAQRLIDTIGAAAVLVLDVPKVELSADPDDHAILAAAVAGRADLIVTGDKRHLLTLGRVGDIAIVTAREALERLRDGG